MKDVFMMFSRWTPGSDPVAFCEINLIKFLRYGNMLVHFADEYTF